MSYIWAMTRSRILKYWLGLGLLMGLEEPNEKHQNTDSTDSNLSLSSEITSLIKEPSWKVLFPNLDDEVLHRYSIQWTSWVNGIDLLASGNIEDLLRPSYPASLIIEVLRARGLLINNAIIGTREYALVSARDGLAIIEFGARKERNTYDESLRDFLEYYGCMWGREYITCPSATGIYIMRNLRNVVHVRDSELNIEYMMIRVGDYTYAFDPSAKAISDFLVGIGVVPSATIVNKLLYLARRDGVELSNYIIGFIYSKPTRRIVWSPGIVGYMPRQLTKDEVVNEVLKLRNIIDEVMNAFEKPEIALQQLGLHVAYVLFRAYRKILGNADTPTPIIYGIPNLNKTTLAQVVNESLHIEGVPLLTEGVQITETVPRLAGLMSESTLPVVLDDVIMNDVIAKIILQIGASSKDSIDVGRARRRGPGLEDKIPITRMIIPIINAESEEDIVNELIDAMKMTRLNKARLMALLGRRVVLINMNKAMPNGAELRRIFLDLPKPDLLALFNYIATNYHDDVIKLMRQDYADLQSIAKYLNYLWFAYGLWKWVIPAVTDFKVIFDDVASAIKEIAQKREETHQYMFEVAKQEVRQLMEHEDEEKIRQAYRNWLDSLRIQLNGMSDELIALIRNAGKARVLFKRPKNSDERVEIKKQLINLVCIEYTSDDYTEVNRDSCTPKPGVTADLINELNKLMIEDLVIIYLLYRAFSTKGNPQGIGTPRQLLGRSSTLVDGEHGYRFTLPELLAILYPSLRTELEETPSERNTSNTYTPTSSEHKKVEKFDETGKGIESVQSQIPPTENLDSLYAQKQVGESVLAVLHDSRNNERGGTNVSGQNSYDCEVECKRKYPGTDPMSMLGYMQCVNECRLLGGGSE